MKSIITNLGSSVTADVFRMKMKKFVLIGSRSDNDTTLTNILDNNTITDTNINNQSNISNYIITKPADIDNSMITNDKTLVITLNLQPGFIDPTYYIYAIALVDETGDIYAISMFSENFNSISEAGEIITIRFKLTGTDIIGNEFVSVSDESYITRREFIEWANNHNHDKQYATIRYLNNVIDELDQIKENKGTIGRLEDIKSLNNNNIVNVLNEIIENLGDINSLDVTTRDSIVSAINKIYSIIGDPKKLTKYDNIIESLEDIRHMAENSSGGVFADGVKVEDVSWGDKADLVYVGDLNNYHGAEKGSIVDSLNEIYDETIGNNSKVHKIAQISTNTNYKIFDKTQDYSGLMKITTFKNSIINSYFEVEVNTTPETIKIKNVSIKDELLNVGFINDNKDINNYIYGLSIVYNDKCLYLSVFNNEDKDGNILYDKIFIDYIKMNQQSTLSEEQFSTEGSISIREGAGIYNNGFEELEFDISDTNKEFKLFENDTNLKAKVQIVTDNVILSTDLSTFSGKSHIKLNDLVSNHSFQIDEIEGKSRLFDIDSFGSNSISTFNGWFNYPRGSITLPGNPGAGVGVAPKEMALRYGLAEMTGTNDPTHENYGNYVHTASGSIMVYIPLHYQKITQVADEPYAGMRVDISNTMEPGYHIPRVFINGGNVIPGIFIDKYVCSNSNGSPTSSGGTFVSLPGKSACTSDRLSYLKNGCSNYNYYFYQAVKSRGSQFALYPIFAQSMLSNLADAIWQEEFRRAGGTNTVTPDIMNRMKVNCAWADRQPFRPRMSTNNLRDNYDTSLVFRGDNYNSYSSNTSLTGGTNDPSTFAKTTHNGQKCGITDLGGWYIVCSGFTHSHILKESEDLTNLVYSDVYGSVNTNKFESLNGSWSGSYLGDTSTKGSLWIPDQILDRNNQEYKLMACNIAGNNPGARSSSGNTNRYGYTYNYKTTSNYAPIVGGNCSNSNAGVRYVSNYGWTGSIGVFAGRACLLPTP